LATPWHERIGNQLRNAIERSIKRLRWPPIGYTDLTLACGDYVLDDKEMVEQILNELSETRRHKVRAIEMESTGIARSLNSVLAEGAQLTVIKSISDFAFGKTDSAQPGAQLIAAAFVRALLLSMMRIKGRKESAADPSDGNADIIASLSPRPEILRMLSAYPPELARAWRATAIDGAFEIFSCAQASNKYGGYRRSQILCEVLDVEWPVDFGGLNEVQLSGLETGIIGSRDGSGLGWLNSQRGTPNRIRVLLEPPEPAVLDRGTISLRLGNSDYFSVRTVTELSRRDFQGLKPNFGELFPERWAEPQHRFSNRCVPYHVSAQAVLIVRPDKRPDARYLLLASNNPAGLSIAQGWGATMAEQMWASGRSQRGEPWWEAPLSDRRLLYRQPETREGDPHINETLARGLREEFQINVDKDCYQEPLLLSVAIEQDMYFVTFIYFVEVKLALEDVYQRWNTAPDKQEMGLLAAYQLTGRCGDGTMMDGARRLAELVAVDEFDAGPHLLPSGVEDARLKRRWHVSSKLRMYACGMHLWPREFSRYVRISA
jgi:hypothetical protein